MLDDKSEKAIAQVTAEARTLFGADLVSLVLYGSAAGQDFVSGRSDLNVAIVLERLTFAHLKALHGHLPRWHTLGVATPLLLDRPFVRAGRDVFPTEFQDIKAQHRVLWGEDVFATLVVDSRHLRYQCEHEARSKLLRLRALYAEVGADRPRLESLMLASVKTFLIIMRNFIRLHGGQDHTRYSAVLDQFEQRFAVSFPVMRQLLRVKLGAEPWTSDIDETFRAYLGEVEQLIELLDRVLPETRTTPPRGAT